MTKGNKCATNRRELLAMTLGGAALATLMTQRAAAASKINQASAGYQASPNGNKRCQTCNLFVAPNGCKSVEGSVAPSGFCRLYVAKV